MTDPRRTAFGGLRAAALLAALSAFLSVPASHAQDGERLTSGNALVTGFSGAKTKHVIDIDGASLRVLDLPAAQGREASFKFSIPARQIGQVFGIALDDAQAADGTPSPNAYVTATSLYGLSLAAPNAAGTGIERTTQGRASAYWMQGQWGDALKGGPGSIYKIDGKTGEATLFATIALDKIPNSGPALGNISFDARSQNLYVSDRETGMIFRLDLDGNVLGEFDHGVFGRRAIGLDIVPYDPLARADIKTSRFRSDDPDTWGLPVPERRVFGIAAWRGKLYYAVADGPQIWSVPIGVDGSFGTARFEANLPDAAQDFEVSDIVFAPDGDMLLALRGAIRGTQDYSGKAVAKGGQVLRYAPQEADDDAPGHWVSPPGSYYVGQLASGSSGDGGVALSAAPCAGTVWATGSALTSGRAKIDGLQGVPADAATETPKPPRDPLIVDFDGAGPSTGRTGYLGDVAIVRACEGGASGYSEAQLAEARPQQAVPQEEPETQDGPESGGPGVGGGPGDGPGGGTPGRPADPLDALTVTKTGSSCRFGETCGFNITFENTGAQDIVFEGIARDELRRHHDGVWVTANVVAIPGSLAFCSATPNALPFDCSARPELAPGESHTFGVSVEMNNPALDPADPNNHGPGGVVQLRNCFVLDSQARSFGPTCATVVVDGPDAAEVPDPVAGKFGLQKTCGAFDSNGKAKCQVSIIPSSTRIEDAISVTLRDEVTYRTDNGGAGVANLRVWDFCDYPSANVALCSFRAENLMLRRGDVPPPLNIVVDVDQPRDATQGVLKNCVTLEVWGPGDQRLQQHEPAEVCAEIDLDAPPPRDEATIADLKVEKSLQGGLPCTRRGNDEIACGFTVTVSNTADGVFEGTFTISDVPTNVRGGAWADIVHEPQLNCIVLAQRLSCTGSLRLEPGANVSFAAELIVPADQNGRTQFKNCTYLADGAGRDVHAMCIDVPLAFPPDPAKPALTVRKKGPGSPCPSDGKCEFTVEIANEGAEPYQGDIGLVDIPVLGAAGLGNVEIVGVEIGACTQVPPLPVQSLSCRVPLDLGPQGSGTDVKSFRIWVRPVQAQVQGVTEGRNCVTVGTPALADAAQGQAFDPEQTYHHACAGFELEIATPIVPELTKTAASETCVYGEECTFEVTIKNPSNVAPLILDGSFQDRPWSKFYESGSGPWDVSIASLPVTALEEDICGDTPPLSTEFHCRTGGYTLAAGEERKFIITLRLIDPSLDPDGPAAAGREVRLDNCVHYYKGSKFVSDCASVQVRSPLPEGLNEKDGVRIDKTCPVCAEGKVCRCDIQVTVPRDVPRLSYLTVDDVAGSSVDSFSTFVLQGDGTDAGWSCPAADATSAHCVLPALALRDNNNDPRVYNLAIGVGRKEGRTDSIKNCATLILFDSDSRPLSDTLIHCAHVVIRDVEERVAELPVREPKEGCEDGFDWDEARGRCVPDGSWNPEEDDGPFAQAGQPLTADDGCPDGFYRDETRGRCKPGQAPEPEPAQEEEPEGPAEVIPSRPSCTGGRVPRGDDCVCPSGTEWNSKAGRCREVRSEQPEAEATPSRPACPSGTSYDPDKKKCVSNCRAGQTWDAKRKRCVTPPAKLTCLNGGEVRGKICWCGFGRFPFPVQGRKNTFECKTISEPKEPKEPQRESGPEPKEPQPESTPETTPETKEPSITCANGTVRNGKCRCRKGFVLEKTGPNAWKCFQPYEGGVPPGTSSTGKDPSGGGATQTRPNATTPKPAKPKQAKPKPPSNKLVCRGGKVRGSLCWCGLGKFPKKVPGTANTWQCR